MKETMAHLAVDFGWVAWAQKGAWWIIKREPLTIPHWRPEVVYDGRFAIFSENTDIAEWDVCGGPLLIFHQD